MAEMTVAAWIAVASAAVSAVSFAISLSQGTPALGGSDQGALLNKKGVDNPRLVAYGKCLVPGASVYKNIRNTDRKWMIQVHSLGHGPFKKIDAVYIDEQPIFGHVGNDLAEKWVFADQNGFGNVQVGMRRGNYQNEVWPLIVGNGDGEWTEDMKGHSIASLQFLVERPDTKGAKDQEYRIMGTSFQSSALVEGVPVIDPTLDPMLLGISDPSKRVWMNGSKEVYRNPVYQLLSYLCDPMYGVSLKPSMINLQTFINSAQWCEREGMKGDGYINQGDTYQKIIEGFASSWGGNIYLEDGKICCAPETVSPVVETINEDDLIGSMTVTNDRGGYANLIKVEWQDKDTQYNKNTFIIPSDIQTDPTIQEDGKVFERSIEIPMSTDIEYIKRYANRELKRERLCRKEAVFTINNLDKTLRLNDVFVINNELYGLDANTKWRVTKIEQSLDEKTIQSKITAIQYDSRVYDTSDYMDSNVGGDLGRPSINILPVADLRFVQNNTTDIGSGMLSFESQYYGEQTFRIQYKLSASSATEWIQYGEFPFSNVLMVGLQSGTNYDFKVQCAATIGSSKWSELKNQRVNKNISLPAVKNLSGNFTSANAVWTWDAINEPIVNNSVVANTYNNLSELVHYYEVAILHGVTTKKTYRTTTPNFTYLFDDNSKNGLSRDVTARVTAISIYGDRGQTTSLKLFNEPMSQPGGVKVEGSMVGFTVSWATPSSVVPDYLTTDIYVTPSQQTLPEAKYLVGESATGSFINQSVAKEGWCIVAHRDYFGSTSPITGSAPIFYTVKGIDDLLTDSPSFQEVEDNLAEVKKELVEQGGEIVQLNDTVALQETAISNNKTLIETTNSKLAQITSTVTAQGVTITEQTQALSQLDGQVSALKTIKLDVNGKISGLQMANDGTTSTFDVLADVFRVSHGTSSQSVFEIRDSKTYIKNAMIGDLTASQIRAGSITGNEINSNSIIRAGSGNTSATLDGSNASWRLYAGNTNPAAAPFRVNTSGKMFATNCDISGIVNATSGSFTGNINAQSGSISGLLTVGNSQIDGRPGQNFLVGSNGRFVVNSNGDMTCQFARITGGEFGGTVKVENLQGDIYRKGFYSNKVIPPVIISGGSGEREFFRADISYQPFNQRVVLSYVDVPIRMYDNPGKCEVYYQIQGQSPVWLQNIDGPNGTKATPLLNFSVVIPTGSTWVRFFIVPFNKITYERAQAIAGVIEMMKSEQIGWSVTTT